MRSVLLSLLAAQASALKILVNNDDTFASGNIREFYKALKASGHDVLLVAPAVQQSGKGGTTVFASTANLTAPAEFNTIPAGAPSFGTDPADSSIWYYNGTPAACTFFALDYVVPKVWNGTQPDLLVSGPNEGTNLGPFLYTLSGTLGATYAAVERGIPAIAFSAGNSTHRPYTNVSGQYDPATLAANLSTQLVNQLAKNVKNGRLLPLGYGVTVNLPVLNSTCNNPPFVQTRMTGGAIVDKAVLNTTTGIFTYGDNINDGINACINGDCSLPGETNVLKGCAISVSIFTTDYDAPNCGSSSNVRGLFQPLVAFSNSSSPTNGTSSGSGSASASGSSIPAKQTTNAGAKAGFSLAGAFGVAAAVAALA